MSLKFRNILIFILLILVLSGCNNNSTETIKPTKEPVKQTEINEDYVPINPEDCVFVADTDAQPNISEYPQIAYTDKGYYELVRDYNIAMGGMQRLFFQMGESGDGGYNYDTSIYAYNTETGDVTRVCEGAMRDYMVMGDSLYYFDMQDNIHRMKLQTGESELFLENDRGIYYNKIFNNDGYVIHEIQNLENKNLDTGEIELYDIQLVIDENGEIVKTFNSSEDEILPEYVIE